MTHISVMLHECIDALQPHSNGVYVDATLGAGGHTRALLEASAPKGKVISFDVDPDALTNAKKKFASFGRRWMGIEENFRYMSRALQERGIEQVDGILLDLGFSSDQLSDTSKGISFMQDGDLDMRLGIRSNDDGLTAEEIVNTWSEQDLEKLIRNFGEENLAKSIAKSIVTARRTQKITRTFQLRDIVSASVSAGYERGRIHPATRTFQAIRIIVNDELEVLEQTIRTAKEILKPNGRIAIISFHSLEDRIVKNTLKEKGFINITKKPRIPSEDEIKKNPRSRSAKLRIAKKV